MKQTIAIEIEVPEDKRAVRIGNKIIFEDTKVQLPKTLKALTTEEIEKILGDTKVYVNGKSAEIQKKLFSFGYFWNGGSVDRRVNYMNKPFLFICHDKTITYGDDMDYFIENKNKEITADEILSLEALDFHRYWED